MTRPNQIQPRPSLDGRSSNGDNPPVDDSPQGGPSRTLIVVAGIFSLLSIAIGVLWLLIPVLNPYSGANAVSNTSVVSGLFGAGTVAVTALVLGAAGSALAVAQRLSSIARTWHGATAGAIAVATALNFGSVGAIAIAGYLFGMAMVIAGLVAIALLLRRSPKTGLVLISALAVVILIAFALGVRADALVTFTVEVSGALWQRVGEICADAVFLASTALWAAAAVRTLRASGSSRAFEGWLVRHRRALTVLAAAGPLPYGIARASWLTPWPLFAPSGTEMQADPVERVTGLVLGCGALAACLLTLGLILPWGRVFPRWMPSVGGRAVPSALATVPGTLAALILCVSAIPMLMLTGPLVDRPFSGLVIDLVLPLWFWGPFLALAVWAYAAWRRQEGALSAR